MAGASPANAVWMLEADAELCAACGVTLHRGDVASLGRDRGARCLKCSGLADLVLLPPGDAALTRRATAASGRHAVVLSSVRRRNRHERRGTLVEREALAAARAQCAADADERSRARAKRRVRDEAADAEYRAEFERRLRELFPSCPEAEARTIAQHACEKHSGRVGRSAAAKEFDPRMIELAVRAHARHVHTEYDSLMDGPYRKREARAAIRGDVNRVVEEWRRVSR